jgi:hypothetical protein
VDYGAQYEVKLDNRENGRSIGQVFRASGRELAEQGLTICLDAALTSELVMVSRL